MQIMFEFVFYVFNCFFYRFIGLFGIILFNLYDREMCRKNPALTSCQNYFMVLGYDLQTKQFMAKK